MSMTILSDPRAAALAEARIKTMEGIAAALARGEEVLDEDIKTALEVLGEDRFEFATRREKNRIKLEGMKAELDSLTLKLPLLQGDYERAKEKASQAQRVAEKLAAEAEKARQAHGIATGKVQALPDRIGHLEVLTAQEYSPVWDRLLAVL